MYFATKIVNQCQNCFTFLFNQITKTLPEHALKSLLGIYIAVMIKLLMHGIESRPVALVLDSLLGKQEMRELQTCNHQILQVLYTCVCMHCLVVTSSSVLCLITFCTVHLRLQIVPKKYPYKHISTGSYKVKVLTNVSCNSMEIQLHPLQIIPPTHALGQSFHCFPGITK